MLTALVAHPFAGYLFIFFARVMDVSLDVFRLLLLTRGYAMPAALIGFVEVTIFVTALSTVIGSGITDPIKIVAYAAGFATGNLVGIYVEGRMAVGYVAIQIFPSQDYCQDLLDRLRKSDFGFTSLSGQGRSGPREVFIVTVKRKDLPRILQILDETAPDTFFNISDVRSIRGGIFPHRNI
ncbi:DUF2179 domain-containing protein [Acetonema longum]|uniref:UPF0316 protein ALO_02116 n=1 Tax=Acetonema longum DSM 6540 TaxID=1009370 RepID=F7NEG0_9FIRM|nr:DUF5698 domain-containing protein [Acetonema longum]EGO65371.1 hypothetical protein ALO_02116 [Acetonema longum DSM 6540]